MKTLLYIHGMGGGGDSRIPRLLREQFAGENIRVVIRTYDFDPETGHAQIVSWVDELRPDLVIGESLGAIQALRIRGIPHLYVSPSLGAPAFLYRLAWICRIPGGPALLHRIWPVKEGDRAVAVRVCRPEKIQGALGRCLPGGCRRGLPVCVLRYARPLPKVGNRQSLHLEENVR